MEIKPLEISDVLLLRPEVFVDQRGFFSEIFQADRFAQAGLPRNFVQENHSGSHRNTLRGMHYQIQQTQGKLISVIVGDVFDVSVDLRKSSDTFGKWVGVYLSAKKKEHLWVPAGFAHGFFVLSDWAEMLYRVTDYYAPEWERTLLWDDPDVAIRWPIPDEKSPQLSSKDLAGLKLSDAELYA